MAFGEMGPLSSTRCDCAQTFPGTDKLTNWDRTQRNVLKLGDEFVRGTCRARTLLFMMMTFTYSRGKGGIARGNLGRRGLSQRGIVVVSDPVAA